MAEAGLSFTSPRMEAMGLGLSSDPRTPVDVGQLSMGESQLRDNAADAALGVAPRGAMTEPVPLSALPPASSTLQQQPAAQPTAGLRAPAQTNILYSPSTQRFSVGGFEFGADEYDKALAAQANLGELANIPGGPQTQTGDWTSIQPWQLQNYFDTIVQPRGFSGAVNYGAKSIAESTLGGIGLMTGSEDLVDYARSVGPSSAEEARNAAIMANRGFVGQVRQATTESLPSVGLSLGAGIAGGAALGALTGTPIGALLGGIGGAFLSVLPMEYYASWEAAERGNADVNDPDVQAEILNSALGKAFIQSGVTGVAGGALAKGLSPALREATKTAARRTMGKRLKLGLGAGAAEGMAESTAELVDMVMFDPELRPLLNESDIATMTPLVMEKYGRQLAIAFASGAILGGGIGVLASGGGGGQTAVDPNARPSPKRNVDSGQAVDGLTGASVDPQPLPSPTAEQAAEAPPQYPADVDLSQFGYGSGLPNAPSSMMTETGALDYTGAGLAGLTTPPPGLQTQSYQLTPDMRTDTLRVLTPEERVAPPPLALPAPTSGGTVITPAPPYQLTPAMRTPTLPPYQTSPQQRTDTVVPLTPELRTDVGAVPQRRTDIPPGAQRLRTRPSERAEAYAPVPEAPAAGPMAEQLNALLRQQQATQEAQAAAQAEAAARTEQEAAQRTQQENQLLRSQRVQRELLADTDQLGAQFLGDAYPTLSSKARTEWADAVRALDPEVRQEVLSGDFVSAAGVNADISLSGLADILRDSRRQSPKLRRQAAEPPTIIETEAAPESPLAKRTVGDGLYGTKDGAPFKSELAANGKKGPVAADITAETDQNVTKADLVAEKVKGGYALRVRTPEDTTPPTGGGKKPTKPQQQAATKRERQKKAADKVKKPKGETGAVQEQGAEAGPVREGPEAGREDGGRDTQGQEAAGEGQAETEAETEVQADSVTETQPEAPKEPEKPLTAQGRRRRATALRAKQKAAVERAQLAANTAEVDTVFSELETSTGKDFDQAAEDMFAFAFEPAPEAVEAGMTEYAYNKLQGVEPSSAYQSALRSYARNQGKKFVEKTPALEAELKRAGVHKAVMEEFSNTNKAASNPATRLADAIVARNNDPGRERLLTNPEQREFRALVKDLREYAEKNPGAYTSAVKGGGPLYQYLQGDSVRMKGGKIVSDERAVNPDTQDRESKGGGMDVEALAKAPRGGTVKGGVGGFKRVDFNGADPLVSFEGKALRPMPRLRIDRVVKKALARMGNPPRVITYKNQADLKSRNPRLYNRAAAARPQGDFDTVRAAGYSFGDGDVLIFSDNVFTEDQLNFVLAHETVGHYGLRGIIPAAEFDALMESIYDQYSAAQQSADIAMANNPEMSKAEAVEEYLADYAAAIDTSLLRRIAFALKNGLNRLGVKFSDDYARYLISQARSYVRFPRGSFPDLNQIGQDMMRYETANVPGRFSRTPSGNLLADNTTADEVVRMGVSVPQDMQAAVEEGIRLLRSSGESFESAKVKYLSLLNFASRQNPGLKAGYDILMAAVERAQSIRVRLNEGLDVALDNRISIFGKEFFGGTSRAERDFANNFLYHGRRRAVTRLTEKNLGEVQPLVIFDEASGTYLPNKAEIKRLDDLNRVKLEEMRTGFDYTIKLPDGKTETVSVPGDPTLTKESRSWLAYEQVRDVMVEVEVQLLLAKYTADRKVNETAIKEMDSVFKDGMTKADERQLKALTKKYIDMYGENSQFNPDTGTLEFDPAAIEKANAYLVDLNTAMIARKAAATDAEAQRRNEALKQYFDATAYDDLVTYIEDMKTRTNFADQKFSFQSKIKALNAQAESIRGADRNTVKLLSEQYSPIDRKGRFQARVKAVLASSGQVVTLEGPFADALAYSQFDTFAEADRFAKQMRETFGDTTYEANYRNADGEFVAGQVRLQVETDRVRDAGATPLSITMSEFFSALRYFDIQVGPKKMEQLITIGTQQDSAARRRLETGFNPGDTRQMIDFAARHIDSRASTIAKTIARPQLEELMNPNLRSSNDLWEGDEAGFRALETEWNRIKDDPAVSVDRKRVVKSKYEEARYMYENTKPRDGENRANFYRNQMGEALQYITANTDVATSDVENNEVVSFLRMFTSIVQLGGSLAQVVLNHISVYTNGIPFLATRNEKTAFGGGFGLGNAVREHQRATGQVGMVKGTTNLKMNRADFWAKVRDSKELREQYNVTKAEARMLERQIREGNMIPAQTNAMQGTARGRKSAGGMRKIIDVFMGPFNLSEQAARRSLGLAAFRLEYARRIGAIDPDLDVDARARAEEQAFNDADAFVSETLRNTLGEYATISRPQFFRSGLAGLIYMYKVYPTTTIQLFSNLDAQGKLYMAAGLFLLGGLMALPFAEEVEDLIDTVGQTFGLSRGSIRVAATEIIEEFMPGASPYILTGAANKLFGIEIASRVSLSPIPGTDMLLAGTDTTRAITDILGPMASAVQQSFAFGRDMIRAPFTAKVDAAEVLRRAPITFVRNAADAYAYTQAGAVVDKRGYKLTDDVGVWTLLSRVAGFYPADVAADYQAIKYSKRVVDYRREAATGFRTAYVRAKVEGDRRRMREIKKEVREWNRQFRGTGLEIDNFDTSVEKAYKEAVRSVGERTLRTFPTASRDSMDRFMNAITQ